MSAWSIDERRFLRRVRGTRYLLSAGQDSLQDRRSARRAGRRALPRDDGVLTTAGAFVGTGDRRMLCSLNSAVLRPDAAGFVVLDDQGREVVSADLQDA